MSTKHIYIIEMPGKPPKEVTNIKIEIVARIVENAGGKIYQKPENVITSLPVVPVIPEKISIKSESESELLSNYNWNEVLTIINDIKNKYFNHNSNCMNCNFVYNKKLKSTTIGRAIIKTNTIELSDMVVSGKLSSYLQQVIFHELCHIEFPYEGHKGLNFRYKEKNNPFRLKKTNCLTRLL